MREHIDKKLKTAEVFGICTVAAVLVWLILMAVLSRSENQELFNIIVIPLIYVVIALVGIFLSVYVRFRINVNWLRKLGIEGVADDIDLTKPTIAKAKLYCGRKACYSKKTHQIIPYAEILWAYLYEHRVNGISTERALILRSKDGKKFTISTEPKESVWLLENYIVKNAPGIILGYGKEQKKSYNEKKVK